MEPTSYWQDQGQPDSLHYRLDAEDIVQAAVDTFRGGVKEIVNGKKVYFDEQRLMNDLGIARAKMIMESGVNKVNHLTKYKDEERVFRQVRAIINAWIYEVTLCMKKWAPNAYFEGHQLINPTFDKIRNKHLVIAVIENALLQSMLRGTGGFEAELTGKQMMVSEHKDYTTQRREGERPGSWFGGGLS